MSHSTLVYRDLEFNDKNEVLNFLAEKLYDEKFVKEGYQEAVVKREAEYPTALPAEIKVAIPHCDHNLVNEPAIAMGVLKNTVDFQAMDDPSMTLGVKIVIMLALNEPHGHITMLQKIIGLIQNVLKNTVDFQAMDDPSMTLGVKIVIMLALNEPHGHITMLQKIIGLIQNTELLNKMIEAESDEFILSVLKEHLN